jgi:hypothetical protein
MDDNWNMACAMPYFDLVTAKKANVRCFLRRPGEPIHNHSGQIGTERTHVPELELIILDHHGMVAGAKRILARYWQESEHGGVKRALRPDGSLHTPYRRGTTYVPNLHAQDIPASEIDQLLAWLPSDYTRETMRRWRKALVEDEIRERWTRRHAPCWDARCDLPEHIRSDYSRGRNSLLAR